MSLERQNKILSVGMELFLHYGYRRTTMGDIAREAGISRPTLYAVYKNKEAVFAGVAESYMEQLEKKLEESFDPSDDLAEKLGVVLKLAVVEPFSMFKNARMKWELLSIDDPPVQETIKELNDAHERIFARCFENEKEIQTRLNRGPSELGKMVSAACHGMKERAEELAELESMLGVLVSLLALASLN